jgi:thiamine-monophosphate kinase
MANKQPGHPFTARHADSVSFLGEEKLIRSIRDWLGSASPAEPFGIGDDCAVLPASQKPQAVTVDPVIYGRHFDDSVSPQAVGAKLLKRNLSDLAAMGAHPTAAVIALTLPPDVSTRWLRGFYRGLAAASQRYHVPIVGGDVAQADKVLAASLTLIGQSAGKRMLYRRGAKIGDWIYVTGALGGSLAGHHYSFEPRLKEGAWLASRAGVHSLIDLSDGLAKDLRALLPVKSEAALDPKAVPISRAAQVLAKADGRSPLHHALSDGEDYELLFTFDGKADKKAFEQAWKRTHATRLSCLGQIVKTGSRPSGTIDLSQYHGYEHLR